MTDTNSGWDPAPEITDSGGRVAPLADALVALGQELALARENPALSELNVYDVEGVFSVEVTADAQGRLGVWVVNTEGAAAAHHASHRVRFRLGYRVSDADPSATAAAPSVGDSWEIGEPTTSPAAQSWDEGSRPG